MKIMQGLRKHNKRYYFKIRAGDEFWDVVCAIKKWFRRGEYKYNLETKEWSVPARPRDEAKLELIFDNAQQCFAALESQLPLFEEGGKPHGH